MRVPFVERPMRNTLEYPITKKEIIEYLDWLKSELNSAARVGDMGPLLLEKAKEIVNKAEEI